MADREDEDKYEEFLKALGGENMQLFEEFGKVAQNYPHLSFLIIEFVRDSGRMAREMVELRHNVETLKSILIDAGVMRPATKEEMLQDIKLKQDLDIDELNWLSNMKIDDGDLPN